MRDLNKSNTIINLFILSKNNLIIAGFSFFLTITLANYFGPEKFGIYSHVLIIASIVSIFINFGTDQVSPLLLTKFKNIGLVLNVVNSIKLLILFPTILALLIIYKNELLFLIFIGCLLITNFNFSFIYEACNRNAKYSYIYLFERSSYIALIFIILLFDKLTLEYLFLIALITASLSILYQWTDLNTFVVKYGNVPYKFIMSSAFYSLPIFLIGISNYSYGGYSRLILERQLGDRELGIYSVGWQLITIGTIYQSQVSRLWRIKFTEAIQSYDHTNLVRDLKSYLLFSTLPMSLVSLFILFANDSIVFLLFSEQYTGLSSVLSILGFYLIVINLAGLVDMLWVALSKTYVFMIINIFSAICLILFLLSFSQNMSIKDFAIITVSAHLLTTILSFLIWFTCYKRSFIALH
jgi:O-antigen/teichoic acid export membrane protein